MKWGFIPQGDGKPHYLVVNADESEPGTCKDIPLMLANPHSLVEGVAIASFAIRANHAFIYVRGEVVHVIRRMQQAVADAYAAGYLGKDILGTGYDLEVTVHAGAGAYICGEETALLDSLEGRRGQPRLRPPFPAIAGLYASPTVVNNVESIASVPSIVNRGVEWFTSMGTEKSKGFTLYSLSGHVERPGQYEAPLGITLRELLDLSGGVREGHELKFWTPGGSSTPLLTAEHLDIPLDYEAMVGAGSMLGHEGAADLRRDDVASCAACCAGPSSTSTSRAASARRAARATYWLVDVLRRLEAGEGEQGDIELLARPLRQHHGSLVLRPRRRSDQPDHLGDPVLPERVRGRHAHTGLGAAPVRRLHALRGGARLMTVTTSGASAPATIDLVTLTIDGIETSVPKGTLVIRAAEQLGLAIPRFCDHPLLDPVGACRQCLVEVEGQRKPLASCTTTVTDGMVVRTQLTSALADKAQQGVMEMLLINHPLDCPICDKGGECPLQNQAMSNGRGETRFDGPKRTFPKPIPVSSQVLLDRERCISCARCTRFSAQIAGDPFIDLLERGSDQQIGIAEGVAVRVLLLRQHRPDLSGRGADRYGVPVPLAPLRPRVEPIGV